MARAYKNPSIVSGISIDDILSLDPKAFDLMSPKERREVTSRLVSAANKRLARLDKAGEKEGSGAYKQLKASGREKLSIRGKNDDEVKKEFNAAKNFLRHKASSLKGIAKLTATTHEGGEKFGEFRNRLAERINEKYPGEAFGSMFTDTSPLEVELSDGTTATLEDIAYDIFNKEGSVDDAYDAIEPYIRRLYEQARDKISDVEEEFNKAGSVPITSRS